MAPFQFINWVREHTVQAAKVEQAATTKTCPQCLSDSLPLQARKCKFCCSVLESNMSDLVSGKGGDGEEVLLAEDDMGR